MARVIKSGVQSYTGTIGEMTYYTIQGSDIVYARRSGGPSKDMIKTSPKFDLVRRNNKEWAGCTQLAKMIRNAYGVVKSVEDYPVIGTLNGLSKKIQQTDISSELRKRGLFLTKNKHILSGFNISRKQVLESVLRVPITASIDRISGVATIKIPTIITNLHLYNFRKLPYFRISINLGGISDVAFSDERAGYQSTISTFWHHTFSDQKQWLPTHGTIEEQICSLQYQVEATPVSDDVTIILTVGIDFGAIGNDGKPTLVKYAGCGKIICIE